MVRADRCFTVDDFRLAARRHLPRGLFEFIDRGAERETALDNNIAAFTRLKLKTQFLGGGQGRDMSVELFGRKIAFPAAIAPTGAAGLCWFQGEIALARAAAGAGIPFTLTTTALVSMESVAREAGGILWFQLYPWKEAEDTFAIIERLRDLPYEALVVTIDWGVGRTREHMDRTGFTDPISLSRRFVIDMLRHPRWVAGVLGRYGAAGGLPRHENFPSRFRFRFTTASSRKPQNSENLTWADIARIRAAWPRTLIVKGILSPIDARNVVDAGADGIVVSNHGGRALDSAVATIDVLPEIVAAVGSRPPCCSTAASASAATSSRPSPWAPERSSSAGRSSTASQQRVKTAPRASSLFSERSLRRTWPMSAATGPRTSRRIFSLGPPEMAPHARDRRGSSVPGRGLWRAPTGRCSSSRSSARRSRTSLLMARHPSSPILEEGRTAWPSAPTAPSTSATTAASCFHDDRRHSSEHGRARPRAMPVAGSSDLTSMTGEHHRAL